LGLFDPNRRRLILARDAIGVRPLYYHRLGHTFVFASEINRSARDRPDDSR
jgi:asparagine synthase (glutamine-hydrolysing)